MKVRCRLCGKISYSSYERAIDAALGASRAFGGSYRVYPCPYRKRKTYHLTTQSRKGGK
jgi:hypothetical protein